MTSENDQPVAQTQEPPLTLVQIENFRRVLLSMIGPYALIMPAEDVQLFRDRLQQQINDHEIA